ncbi:hypothetical protein SALBM135S_06857 [Streptomyces alboniger]
MFLMNSVTTVTGHRIHFFSERCAIAQTRPSEKAIRVPKNSALSVSSRPSQKSGMKSSTCDQSQFTWHPPYRS